MQHLMPMPALLEGVAQLMDAYQGFRHTGFLITHRCDLMSSFCQLLQRFIQSIRFHEDIVRIEGGNDVKADAHGSQRLRDGSNHTSSVQTECGVDMDTPPTRVSLFWIIN